MVPAQRLKVPGQGVHICTMPLYTKTTLHSGNNIGVILGVFKQKISLKCPRSLAPCYIVYRKNHTNQNEQDFLDIQ